MRVHRVPARVPVALAALLAASFCHAQFLINELSFGHSGRLSSDDGSGRVPHFALSGQPNAPQLLSDRLVLTPVAPGNQRGAIWAEEPLMRTVWEADVEFRASGPERGGRGGGNLNVLLARHGGHDIGAHSIYTVAKFDGLALVVDTHDGSAGMVRGFLNDGSVDYARQHGVDRLAFGHCQYSYRNLGRPSQIKVRQTSHLFRVDVDGRLCFETKEVRLPPGYFFGITAATPDNPDSFEVFKMVVQSDSTVSGGDGVEYATQQKAPPKAAEQHDGQHTMPDQAADVFTTSKEQFHDLHNRLQSAMHQISAVYRSVTQHNEHDDQRQVDMKQALDALRSSHSVATHMTEDLLNRIKDLEKEVRAMRNDINKKFIIAHHDSFQGYLTEHHATLAGAIANRVPGHGKLIAVFVGTQVVLVVAYVVYKRRRASSPKKYL